MLKLQRDISVSLNVSPKTPISGGSKKMTSTKIKISPQKKFTDWFGHTTIEPFLFGSHAWPISSNWSFQRNVGFNLERAQTSEHCFTQSLNNSLIWWSFCSESSRHCLFLSIRAKQLAFWEIVHPHVSHVTCHMSGVMYQVSIFFDMVVELVGGGFVINGPYAV